VINRTTVLLASLILLFFVPIVGILLLAWWVVESWGFTAILREANPSSASVARLEKRLQVVWVEALRFRRLPLEQQAKQARSAEDGYDELRCLANELLRRGRPVPDGVEQLLSLVVEEA
jgi:hypothetical protein